MIVVTGGTGFIGSAIVWRLNQMGEDNIVIVDSLSNEKWKNLVGLKFRDIFDKTDFMQRVMEENVPFDVEAIIHMGACSSTTETNGDYILNNNFRYSVELAKYCLPRKARYIYASSAATYGDGFYGYDDDESKLETLKPLNLYAYSKQMFDLWALRMEILDKIAGLKYFNVYGPNEYHKGDMRSVVHKAFGQINETGKVKLFKSYNDKYKDGEQLRDFIYIKDVVDMTLYFLENRDKNGIYNIGTGKSRTWNDLVTTMFTAMNKPVNIEYIDMPESIRNKYQYYTEASMNKLKDSGFNKSVFSLEDGIEDYVKCYLTKDLHLGTKEG